LAKAPKREQTTRKLSELESGQWGFFFFQQKGALEKWRKNKNPHSSKIKTAQNVRGMELTNTQAGGQKPEMIENDLMLQGV